MNLSEQLDPENRNISKNKEEKKTPNPKTKTNATRNKHIPKSRSLKYKHMY